MARKEDMSELAQGDRDRTALPTVLRWVDRSYQFLTGISRQRSPDTSRRTSLDNIDGTCCR